ncbi:unnamed protein product [Arabidopsis thaliana]|uniref:LIM domain protein n=1 Tax=Arabidopsis thaliana TaxID=3702 RepID=A0A654GAR1_ARATH|nr:unnamed protein product [Arabidopsis thaliana]
MAGDLLCAKTQRFVLLIDLNPLLIKPNSEQYLAVVISAAEKLLLFPPLSASLFSFKFFFSSLSSLLSSSKLSSLSISSSPLSFDLPNPTLVSLKRAIDAVKGYELRSSSTVATAASPRGVNVAANLRQIVYDYAWEPVVRDPEIGMIPGFTDGGLDVVRSNLVVMFSPISRDLDWVSEFLDVKSGDECFSDLDLFKSKLREIFYCVNELFDDRDIQLSWIDVKSGDERCELGLKSGFFDSGIRELGWGHCSTDSIVFGSSVVPFGLIYPAIGISPKLSTSQKFTLQASLEIADINGKPMECKCGGELEFSSSEIFSGKRCDEFINLASGTEPVNHDSLVEQFCDGSTKLSIKALRMCDDLIELERYTCDTFVVHQVSQDSDQDQEEESAFWADLVFQILGKETGERVAKRSSPIWQILLSYLYREGFSALVSFSNSNGSLRTGILKPFTFSSALICVFDNGVSPQTVDHEDSRKKVSCSEYKRKPRKNSLNDISWEEFCRSVKDYGQIDLEDVYFFKYSKSKKLKFLKCWMKQISKPRGCSLSVASNCNALEDVDANPIEEKNNSSEETDKASSPLPLAEEDIALSGNRISGKQESNTYVHASESSENFFVSLPSKIKQGIESEEIDLSALAERLVKSCVFYSSQRAEKDYSCESGTLLLVIDELTKMLLKDPKDLVAKFKKKDSSSVASERNCDEAGPSRIVREYELQILFRMEILRCKKGLGNEESVTQKFAKQICMFLEGIQCKLDGGFFGEWSLDKYVDKTIKARYQHILGGAVNIIYTEMDLLMFTDEDLEDSFMNNEDSSQSGRENIHSNFKNHHHSQSNEDVPGTSKQKNTEESREAKKEVEAQGMRERARRFSSFTSWMPDLCRVWAPKQTKNSKGKADQQQRTAKRKKEQRSVEYDRVCETPMTTIETKRIRTGNKDDYECETLPRSSVPKALFQDDCS